jgi:excinuclease ABC subunit C
MTAIQPQVQRPRQRAASASTSESVAPVVTSITRGRSVVQTHLKTLPNSPGVYRMIDDKDQVLYVGKAKNLKKRVASYANLKGLTTRILGMVAATVDMEFITTHTEVEALLLESNLIKELKPRYNILLRDDKSFPYILITGDHAWAQITKHRGARNRTGEYFGPFASAGAVNETLNALQRAFPLRSCSDSIFTSRTRPCLQYQIRRCTAPCVDRISQEDYEQIVHEARDFLSGRSHRTQQELSERMQEASSNLEFETAAVYRDRIRALTQIQARQGINIPTLGEADVIGAYRDAGQTCIQVFFFRSGQNYGNRAYFPAHAKSDTIEEVISAFIGQFYADNTPPSLLLASHDIEGKDIAEKALGVRADRRVYVQIPHRGAKRKLIEHAVNNAREALARRLAESASQRRLLEGVARTFGLEAPPERIEVYDNSHIGGSAALGAMIVAGPEGLLKNQYRKFNIKQPDLTPGDDYGMMTEVLTRRFSRLLKEDENREGLKWPDLILIDGGAGHLSTAQHVFADLGISGVALAAIAKGPDRNAGRETFHVQGRRSFSLEPNDPVLYFLQRLRDEAHRYAIGSHRAKRSQKLSRSALDEISGIGAKRKRALLHHFGSARSVERAGLADLEAVEGISSQVAKAIYDHFHPGD